VNALSTTSDTNVSKKRVDGKILLQDDDLIEIGQRQFIFHSLFPNEKAPGSAMVSFHTLYAISTHHPAHSWFTARMWLRCRAPDIVMHVEMTEMFHP